MSSLKMKLANFSNKVYMSDSMEFFNINKFLSGLLIHDTYIQDLLKSAQYKDLKFHKNLRSSLGQNMILANQNLLMFN